MGFKLLIKHCFETINRSLGWNHISNEGERDFSVVAMLENVVGMKSNLSQRNLFMIFAWTEKDSFTRGNKI